MQGYLRLLSQQQVYVLQSRAMTNLDSIIRQLRAERDRLDTAIVALTSVGGNTASRTAGRRGRRHMSPAARRRIAAAQRARWQRVKAGGQTRSAPVSKSGRQQGRSHLSAEGLARIRVAQRRRWAKLRAGKKK